ncbi:MAG: translation initiation factor IF-2 subunit alpha [Methanobrevibacter sp.]|jgi:translation initiation factor 2 subunit 1|nr:translation initiation factor IF-2 subunit alpha [Candidatus Methanovirga meridionalis]
MVRKSHEWPKEGELIVATVYKVFNYGAFAKLEEYPNKETFIHISEVSAGWVKNIRDYVRENQKIVAHVLRVTPKKGHVDGSLKRIREDQRTKKIQQWKIEQKAEKFLELAAKSLDKNLNVAYEEVGYELMDIFGDIYGAFESSAEEGASVLIDEGISEDWAKAIAEIAANNISPPEVQITGYLDLQTYAPNGVEIIRKSLKAIESDDTQVKIIGSPRYMITVKSSDYIGAEKILKDSTQKAIKIIEKSKGTGEFLRELE